MASSVSSKFCIWDAYVDNNDFVYFYHREKHDVRWTIPDGYVFHQADEDGGHSHWCAYESDDGEVFYHHAELRETRWSLPVEVERDGYTPIPLSNRFRSEWDCYETPEEKLYYVHRLSNRALWSVPDLVGGENELLSLRPLNKSSDPNNTPHHAEIAEGVAQTYVDEEGMEFEIPEYDEDEALEEQRDIAVAEHHTNNASNNDLANPQVIELKKSRFMELLRDSGVKPYAQWAPWQAKLGLDSRCQDVEFELRQVYFREYVNSLAKQQTDMPDLRQRSLNTAKESLNNFLSTAFGLRVAKESLKVKVFLRNLAKVAESDPTAAVLLTDLSALEELDRKKVVKLALTRHLGG